jgi:glycosyltransferase involved in cell wall biosynthesis
MPNLRRASIIINNFNYGRFLADAIESALAQTYKSTEVVVVDDGSTDNSREVIERYSDRIVAVLKDNGGQGSAYNAGFAVSQGDLVCFLDADDTLFPRAIETSIELTQDPQVVKAQLSLQVVDATGIWHGQLSTKRTPPSGDLRQRVIDDGPLYDFEYHTGSAYRREFLKRVFPMPEEPYRNGSDVFLITLAPVFGLVRTAQEALGTYRAHGANNYRDRPLDAQRLRNYLQRFETNCAVLEKQLVLQGNAVDPRRWKERNFNYLWPTRLLQAIKDTERVVPEGEVYILVDGGEWGDDQLVPQRQSMAFPQRDGQYAGPPENDAGAIDELLRLRQSDAMFIVFWWTCFWWLDHYVGFHDYLRSRFPCVACNDRLIAFDLRRHRADGAQCSK